MGLFHKATKHEAKLRLAIAGPSGSGKTYSSLAIATGLGGPIAFLDTEHGSASKYADLFEFDVMELEAPYHPDKYMQAIKGAVEAGYKVIILDSMTHAWNGSGGILELLEQATKRQKVANSYTAWGDVTPIQNRLIETIVGANIHIIATMRSKQEYVQEKDEKTGRNTIKKVGMAPIQRDGFEYEFDIFLDMDIDNNAVVSKTRCPEMTGKVYAKPGAQVAKILKAWLGGAPAPDRSPRVVVADTGEIVDAPTHGTGHQQDEAFDKQPPVDNPFVDAAPAASDDAPAQHELAIIKQWQGPQDAKSWAIMVGACQNEHHAGQSWINAVKECKGYSEKNKEAVFLAFLRHQHEKLGTETQVA